MTNFTIILLQIVITLLTAYLLYFAKQKGKNQADKEDLKKLTTIVEEVKKENSKEIELLKANLALFADKEKQIFTEEKESIVIFFSQLNTWIWDSLNIYIHEYNHSNYKTISDRLIIIRDSYNKTNVTFSKVKLIIEDEELIAAGHDAIVKTLKLHHFIEGLLKRLSRTLDFEKSLIEKSLNNEINFQLKSKEIFDFYQNQANDNEKEKNEIINEYFLDQKKNFNPAIDSTNSFKKIAKKHLRK